IAGRLHRDDRQPPPRAGRAEQPGQRGRRPGQAGPGAGPDRPGDRRRDAGGDRRQHHGGDHRGPPRRPGPADVGDRAGPRAEAAPMIQGDGLTIIKGAGDLATGVAVRLHRAGLRLLMTELAEPTVVRRTVAFAEAVFAGETTVEGVRGVLCADEAEAARVLDQDAIPVLVDPEAAVVRAVRPTVVIDGVMAKRNLGTTIDDAPVVIALGPGFVAGQDVHAVVETQRGHYLGRAIYSGATEPDTGVPGNIGGFTRERVLRAPTGGRLERPLAIGAHVE